uniref:Uncharacterized protein n=1 Tax=Panagrolaimus davidi TaxID=227884 RepID=A0A914Q4P2_9BILA
MTVIEFQTIHVSGEIKCCTNGSSDALKNLLPQRFDLGNSPPEVCYPPSKAVIKLWDYFQSLPNKLLFHAQFENMTKYDFIWANIKIFDIKPFLHFYIECSNETIYITRHNVPEINPKTISKDYKITMLHLGKIQLSIDYASV